MKLCSHLPTQNLSFVQHTFPVPPGTHSQVPLIKPVRRGSTMRSEVSGACENRGANAAFPDRKPGAGFQAGQVQGRFPPHTVPLRPPWPLIAARPQKSHLASLSRACIPASRETAFSHSPGPGAEGGSRSHTRASAGKQAIWKEMGFPQAQSPRTVDGHSRPELPWAKGEGR